MSKKFKLDKKAKRNIEQQFPDESVGEFSNYEEYDAEEEERLAVKRRRRAKRTARFMIRLTAFFMLLVLIMVSVMLYTGYIWFNEPRKRDYPCRGVIVDNEMGQIGWQAFSRQNISFAYITATKGKDYIDECFKYNKENAASTELLVGYLHIFEPDENGRAQAEHFIEAVGESMSFKEAELTLVCRKLFVQELRKSRMPKDIAASFYADDDMHIMYIGEVVQISPPM